MPSAGPERSGPVRRLAATVDPGGLMHDDQSPDRGPARSAPCGSGSARRSTATTVPLDIEVWHAPGEPVPVGDALAADLQAGRARATRGDRRGGPSWFRLTGRSGRSGTASGSRPSSTWASAAARASPRRASRTRADGEPIKGLQPATTPTLPLSVLGRGGRVTSAYATATGGHRSSSTSRPRPTRP